MCWFHGPWTARSDSVIQWNIVALADATGRESEPIGEDTATLIMRIVGEQAMQSELLFASTTITAPHLLEFVGALFPVDVLLERIEVQQGQYLATCVVRPEWGNDLFFNGTGVSTG